jgi:predicted permease
LLNLNCRAGNTSFLGFPIIEALYGQEGMKTAILVDQRNFCSSLHFRNYRGYYVLKGSQIAFRFLKNYFPPFITFVVACLMNVFRFPRMDSVYSSEVGSGVTPLALVSVGLQLRFERKSTLAVLGLVCCIS